MTIWQAFCLLLAGRPRFQISCYLCKNVGPGALENKGALKPRSRLETLLLNQRTDIESQSFAKPNFGSHFIEVN